MLKELLQNKETIKKRIESLKRHKQSSDFAEGSVHGQIDIYEMWLFSIEQLIEKDKKC